MAVAAEAPSLVPNMRLNCLTSVQLRDPDSGQVDYCGTIQAIRDNMNRGSIQNIGVTPEHRGMQLGTFLIYRAMQGFLSEGLQAGTLEVTAQNTKALRLYERLGFRVTRTVFKAVEVSLV